MARVFLAISIPLLLPAGHGRGGSKLYFINFVDDAILIQVPCSHVPASI